MSDIGRPREGSIKRTGYWPLIEKDVIQFVHDWPEEFTIDASELNPMVLIVAIEPEKMALAENEV